MLLTFCLWDQLKYESSKFDMDWYQPWREIDPLRRSDFILYSLYIYILKRTDWIRLNM